MIRALAALALLSASAPFAATPDPKPADTLSSTAPWWEKVTVTVAGDGKTQSCRYITSLKPDDAKSCDVVGGGPKGLSTPTAAKSEFTQLTFERRFHPGVTKPADGSLDPGDTLLGRQVMSLAIDAAGAVKGCKIIAASGDMMPDYGCDEATAERFEASADRSSATARLGYMTILVYGHAEHLV